MKAQQRRKFPAIQRRFMILAVLISCIVFFKIKNSLSLNTNVENIDYPLFERSEIISRVHCVGENFQNETSSSRFRSCHYRNLCWDGRQIVYFGRGEPKKSSSTLYYSSSSLAPVQMLPYDEQPWVPRNVYSTLPTGNFLPNATIWVPILSTQQLCHENVSMLLDFCLPIFSLLEIFNFVDRNVLITIMNDNPCGLHFPVNTSKFQILHWKNNTPFCALDAVSGTGWLGARHYDTQVLAYAVRGLGARDNGTRELPSPSVLHRPHNLRRAVNFRLFRDYLVRMLPSTNDTEDILDTKPLVTVISDGEIVGTDYNSIERERFSCCRIQEVRDFGQRSFLEQVRVAMESSIYVVFGEIPETALYLAKGSVLIVVGTTRDWEVWNNISYLRVHWLRSGASLTSIIQREVEALGDMAWSDNKSPVISPFAGSSLARLQKVNGPPPQSRVHCIGDNFHLSPGQRVKSWYRSCHYESICYDFARELFVLHDYSKNTANMSDGSVVHLSSWPSEVVPASQSHPLSRGVIRWKPGVRDTFRWPYYHQLQSSLVLLSYVEWKTCNLGHLLWDTYLPIFTLLELFNLEDEAVLLTRRAETECHLGDRGFPFLLARQNQVLVEDNLTRPGVAKSNRFVCARHMLAGMAWLTDHGVNSHGFLNTDFFQPENIGRGPQLARFRDHLLRNANLTLMDLSSREVRAKPYKVTFSLLSSKYPDRRLNFSNEMAAVADRFGSRIIMEGIAMWNHSILQQMEFASQSAIYVSVVGGGTFPAYFLPKGASLILYASREIGMLDWDLWTNYRDVHTHWLDLDAMNVEVLIQLVEDELQRMESVFL